MKSQVLIAGGSGLIGGRLTRLLLERGYVVSWLSRSREHKTSFRVFHWDPEKGDIEKGAVENADHIINLAGAGLADKRWTKARKSLIVESRVKSAQILFDTLKAEPHKVRTYVSASGINYYGDNGDEWVKENLPHANDFLGHCCAHWENASRKMEELGIRTVQLRTAIALSQNGGALPRLAAPVKAGIGAPLGSGKQWVSWIHIDDLCRIYIAALENETLHGPYNAAAPSPVRNRDLIRELARVLGRPLWLPPVPVFALKAVLGELSHSVLDSVRASAGKILRSGFEFRFRELDGALEEIYS